MNIFNLPDLGEGLPDAEIVQWYVKEGDTVSLDQPLVSMETAKAIVDVPSPVAGTIKKLFGKTGEIIPTGAALVEFSNVDVPQATRDTGTVAGALKTSDQIITHTPNPASIASSTHIKATPMVRALADRLHVDLAHIVPTGPDHTITTNDVELAAKSLSAAGDLELLKGVRRSMAHAMQKAHTEIVPVTLIEDAILLNLTAAADLTVKIIHAIARACQAEPNLNAWYDHKAVGRRLIKQLDLGIAVDTADGLFVPVINSANTKDAATLRNELEQLKTQVRDRTIPPEKMRGASFVLSNFGSIAGRYANPIIVPPSVAILGVGKLRDAVVPINNQVQIAKLLPLSLSFDHRACTGGEASRFMGALIAALEAS